MDQNEIFVFAYSLILMVGFWFFQTRINLERPLKLIYAVVVFLCLPLIIKFPLGDALIPTLTWLFLLAGFLFIYLFLGVIGLPKFTKFCFWISIFWSMLNLLPLDGTLSSVAQKYHFIGIFCLHFLALLAGKSDSRVLHLCLCLFLWAFLPSQQFQNISVPYGPTIFTVSLFLGITTLLFNAKKKALYFVSVFLLTAFEIWGKDSFPVGAVSLGVVSLALMLTSVAMVRPEKTFQLEVSRASYLLCCLPIIVAGFTLGDISVELKSSCLFFFFLYGWLLWPKLKIFIQKQKSLEPFSAFYLMAFHATVVFGVYFNAF